MIPVIKKEISSYLSGLSGYLITGLFLVMSGALVFIFPDTSVLNSGYAGLESFFFTVPWLFIFLIPAMTMRAFSEEQRAGTLELLLTHPLPPWRLILGKFWAGFILVMLSLLPTLLYVFTVYKLGDPPGNLDTGGITGSYLGILLMSLAFLAIGIWSSAWSDNPLAALILSAFVCFLLYSGLDSVAQMLDSGTWSYWVAQLGIQSHFQSLGRGVLDFRDALYFISLTLLFLGLTHLRLLKITGHWSKEHAAKGWMLLGILLFANLISANIYWRIDFTKEKRFTLSRACKETLDQIQEPLYVKVYLEGEFPAGFQRLQNATRDMLRDFRGYAGGQIQFEFIDPFLGKDELAKRDIILQLGQKGLQPTDLQMRSSTGQSSQILIPGALLSYRGVETGLNILQNAKGAGAEENLNQSIRELEYRFTVAIQSLVSPEKQKIGFIQGHAEWDTLQLADLAASLQSRYDVEFPNIAYLPPDKLNEAIDILSTLDIVVVAGPQTRWEEKEKFILDQYIMRGGRVLWALDPVLASLDSLDPSGHTVAVVREVNLEDQLFTYGVRLNPDLVQDLQCAPIPLLASGDARLFPWVFYPLLKAPSTHIIGQGTDPIYARFASSIDLIVSPDIQAAPILMSSEYSRRQGVPARISVASAAVKPNMESFRQKNIPVGYALEGSFNSVFANRLSPQSQDALQPLEKSASTKMVVLADADILRNEVRASDGQVIPLGYDRFSRNTFGNKQFVLNCIDWLGSDQALMELRNRNVTLRLLNKPKIAKERSFWQGLNMAGPLVLVFLIFALSALYRKKKYAHE